MVDHLAAGYSLISFCRAILFGCAPVAVLHNGSWIAFGAQVDLAGPKGQSVSGSRLDFFICGIS